MSQSCNNLYAVCHSLRIPMRGYESRTSAGVTLPNALRIPMRGYEFDAKFFEAFILAQLRIPMRGYEQGVTSGRSFIATVTNPHEGL